MTTAIEILRDLEAARFFGSLEIKLEGGKIVLLRKSETIRPTNDCRENRGANNANLH